MRICSSAKVLFAVCLTTGLLLAACSEPAAPVPEPAEPVTSTEPATASVAEPAEAVVIAPARTALFGAVHVHTNNSFDAFTNGTVTTPADAYKWAQGEVIQGDRMGA